MYNVGEFVLCVVLIACFSSVTFVFEYACFWYPARCIHTVGLYVGHYVGHINMLNILFILSKKQ